MNTITLPFKSPRGLRMGLMALFVTVAAGSIPQVTSAQQVRGNINHEMTGTIVDTAVKNMAQELRDGTSGRINLTVHSRGEMGGERAMYDLMQVSGIEMGVSGAAIISAVAPEYSAIDAPYLFRSSAHLRAVMEGKVGDEIRAALLERKGIRVLGWMDRAPRHITTKGKAITSPDDLTGVKIRMREIPVQVQAFRLLGASPVPMAFGEVYSGLQTGVIDSQENPLELITGHSLNEVQDTVSMTGHVQEVQWVIASDLWWQGLSKADQEIVQAAVDKAMAWGQQEVHANDLKLIEDLQARGMTIVQLSDEQRAAFQAKVAPIAEAFAAEWRAGLYEEIVAVTAP